MVKSPADRKLPFFHHLFQAVLDSRHRVLHIQAARFHRVFLEKDAVKASCLNVQNSVAAIKDSLKEMVEKGELTVCGALYHIDSGEVEFLD